MGKHDTDAGLDRHHQEVWELLPWYVNGTLEDRERQRVDRHLRTCVYCQKEVERCDQIAGIIQGSDEPPVSSASQQFAKLMADVETLAADHPSAGHRGHRFVTGLSNLINHTSRGVRWALAAQSAMILILFGMLIWQVSPTPGPAYSTLSDTTPSHPQAVMRMRVIFAADTMESQIRALLFELGGRIVNGPSPIGAYTLEVPLSGESSEPGDALPRRVRLHPKVTLAEPIQVR